MYAHSPQSRSSLSSLLVALLALSLLLASCGGAEDAPRMGDWTLHEAGMALVEDLRVSETENFYFGSITAVDVTSDGHMVVVDRKQNNIKVLGPDGTLVQTLGREGGGPGEFQFLALAQVARGDSIYAFDARQRRLTVFRPPLPYDVGRTVSLNYARIAVLAEGFFGPCTTGPPGAPNSAYHHLCRINEAGSVQDTLLRARRQPVKTVSEDGNERAAPVPFAPSSILAMGPTHRRVYYVWTDRLRITSHTLDGASDVALSVPAPAIPVQESERESALKEIGDAQLRAKVSAALPDAKPALTDFVVADDGTFWVERPPQGPDGARVRWWRLDPDSKTIHEGRIPTDVDLEVVKNGQVYGTTTTEKGAPAVVRYSVEIDDSVARRASGTGLKS